MSTPPLQHTARRPVVKRLLGTARLRNAPAALRWPLLLSSLVLMGACASSTPIPSPAMNAARTAITQAERADASRYAGAELATARQRLAAADAAANARDMTKALHFAEQAKVEAELAHARSEAAKAAAINAEMQRNADILLDELQRKGGTR